MTTPHQLQGVKVTTSNEGKCELIAMQVNYKLDSKQTQRHINVQTSVHFATYIKIFNHKYRVETRKNKN